MEQEKKLLPIKRIEVAWIKVERKDADNIKLERFRFKRKLILVPYRYEKNWILNENGSLTLDVVKRYKCHYCEECNFTDDEITKDHKKPQSKGGTDSIKNIVPACLECNRDKADTPYDEYMRVIQARKKIQLNKLKKIQNEISEKEVNEHNNTHRSGNNNNKLRTKKRTYNSRKRPNT